MIGRVMATSAPRWTAGGNDADGCPTWRAPGGMSSTATMDRGEAPAPCTVVHAQRAKGWE